MLLKRRFPKAAIIQGDAYDIRDTLDGVLTEPGAAVISSLPLFTKPLPERLRLLNAVHELTHHDAPFVQFTYAVVPPIPKNPRRYTATASNRVWLNFPPARVWVYRRK
jgi:phosphatidylethanolamine/phosphatidyl-N-methylethanolamine N-methyltransferase